MLFGRSAKITASTFNNLKKLVLYRVLTLLVSLAVAAVIVYPSMKFLIGTAQLTNFITAIKDLFRNVFRGVDLTLFWKNLTEKGSVLFDFIQQNRASAMTAYGGIGLAILVFTFLRGLSSFFYGNAVSEYMSTLSDLGFFHSFFRRLGHAVAYELVRFLFRVLSIAVCGAVGFAVFAYLPQHIGVLSVLLYMAFLLFSMPFYFTLLGRMMPAMIVEKKNVFRAVGISFKGFGGRNFRNLYACFFAVIFCCEVGIVVGTVASFGIGILFLPTFASMWMVSVSFTDYYMNTGRRFYLDYDHVVVPKALRKEESLLSDINM